MKKVIGYNLFYVRVSQKGDSLIWSTEKSVACVGELGVGRVWYAPRPNDPRVAYFNPSPTKFAASDLDSIKESGYDTLYVKEDFSEYHTVDAMNALLTPQPVVTPAVAPTVEQPVISPQ